MGFLGSLGIDTKLLIAQVVNFGLLLWLLTKFLYRPIIERIEKDERELELAQIQREELRKEKEIFEREKRNEIAKAKQLSKEVIEEAENIAEEIKKEARSRAEKEAAAIIEQSQRRTELREPAIRKEIVERVGSKVVNLFRESFNSSFSLSSREELQNAFWKDIVDQIKDLQLKKIKKDDLDEVIRRYKLVIREGNRKKEVLDEKLREFLIQKIGLIVLEYVYPPSARQKRELEEIISKKIGVAVEILKDKIIQKQNKNLIIGFRFEIMGRVVESNLLSVIQNVAREIEKQE